MCWIHQFEDKIIKIKQIDKSGKNTQILSAFERKITTIFFVFVNVK